VAAAAGKICPWGARKRCRQALRRQLRRADSSRGRAGTAVSGLPVKFGMRLLVIGHGAVSLATT
ncbi:hypothetical protein, partial [Mesorhizobium sp. M7A.F.Ca.CA.002.07.1.1]|uniref:hypothetical protein n=1 Tax=Mesorhizobium sp. M7A.F.Ca.CA.002.07.1.1 TaxID=2496723 RepID=UPI0019D08E46